MSKSDAFDQPLHTQRIVADDGRFPILANGSAKILDQVAMRGVRKIHRLRAETRRRRIMKSVGIAILEEHAQRAAFEHCRALFADHFDALWKAWKRSGGGKHVTGRATFESECRAC